MQEFIQKTGSHLAGFFPAGRTSSLALIALAVASAPVQAQEISERLKTALSFKPQQADVVYELVPADSMAKCTCEQISRDDGNGFLVTGTNGQTLRWFVDTNSDNKPDRWCYYNNGVEVYRETDTDFNHTADEYRWLGTEGLRWGVDENEDGSIDRWNMISAEEVTAEVVRASASRDPKRFALLMLSDEEIDQLGVSDEKAVKLKQRTAEAKKQFESWAAGQSVVTKTSRWTNFAADKPGIVPSGTDGSTRDVVVYENAVALLDEGGKSRQLLVGAIIQVGPAWRIVDLPTAITEGAVISEAGVFFNASFQPRNMGESAGNVEEGGISKVMEKLLLDLQEVDNKLAETTSATDKATLHGRRADLLEKLVSASGGAEDRSIWIRQFAETVGAAALNQEFPTAVERMQDFKEKLASVNASEDDIAYLVFRTMAADHSMKQAAPNEDISQVEKQRIADLEKFVTTYPKSSDSADAMIQLGLAAEFTGDLAAAQKWYAAAKTSFGDTLSGQKAAGALVRLDLAGKNWIPIVGKTLQGQNFDSRAYAGGPVIYHCWTSWCTLCITEMRALKELQSKYAKTKLRIVGINLDATKDDAIDFLKANPYPWPQVHAEGGMDSKLAINYGVLTLPLNFVVDKNGKVVKTLVDWSELDKVVEELVK